MKTEKIGHYLVLIQSGKLLIDSSDTVFKKLSLAQKPPQTAFSLISLKPVVSKEHLRTGIFAATKAFTFNTGFSSRLELEVLIRLSGQRQIKKALELFGLHPNSKPQEAVLIGMGTDSKALKAQATQLAQKLNFLPDSKLIENNFSKNNQFILHAFGISAPAIQSFSKLGRQQAVQALIQEKIALLSLEEKN